MTDPKFFENLKKYPGMHGNPATGEYWFPAVNSPAPPAASRKSNNKIIYYDPNNKCLAFEAVIANHPKKSRDQQWGVDAIRYFPDEVVGTTDRVTLALRIMRGERLRKGDGARAWLRYKPGLDVIPATPAQRNAFVEMVKEIKQGWQAGDFSILQKLWSDKGSLEAPLRKIWVDGLALDFEAMWLWHELIIEVHIVLGLRDETGEMKPFWDSKGKQHCCRDMNEGAIQARMRAEFPRTQLPSGLEDFLDDTLQGQS